MKAHKASQTAQFMALYRALELAAYLQRFNYTLLEDEGAAGCRQKYLPNRTEKGYEFYRVAFATKK